jgi:serine/threonine protein kinase
MVCELMAGGSLQQKLRELEGEGKRLAFDKAFRIGSNIAGAMHYMHSRRPFAVIHRDLKPANVLLTLSGTAKVSDFGLSKMFDVSTPRNPVKVCDTLPGSSAAGRQSPQVRPARHPSVASFESKVGGSKRPVGVQL